MLSTVVLLLSPVNDTASTVPTVTSSCLCIWIPSNVEFNGELEVDGMFFVGRLSTSGSFVLVLITIGGSVMVLGEVVTVVDAEPTSSC